MNFDYYIIGKVSGKRNLEKKFETSLNCEVTPNYRLAKNEKGIIVHQKNMKARFEKMSYGMIPFWQRHLKNFIQHRWKETVGQGR